MTKIDGNHDSSVSLDDVSGSTAPEETTSQGNASEPDAPSSPSTRDVWLDESNRATAVEVEAKRDIGALELSDAPKMTVDELLESRDAAKLRDMDAIPDRIGTALRKMGAEFRRDIDRRIEGASDIVLREAGKAVLQKEVDLYAEIRQRADSTAPLPRHETPLPEVVTISPQTREFVSKLADRGADFVDRHAEKFGVPTTDQWRLPSRKDIATWIDRGESAARDIGTALLEECGDRLQNFVDEWARTQENLPPGVGPVKDPDWLHAQSHRSLKRELRHLDTDEHVIIRQEVDLSIPVVKGLSGGATIAMKARPKQFPPTEGSESNQTARGYRVELELAGRAGGGANEYVDVGGEASGKLVLDIRPPKAEEQVARLQALLTGDITRAGLPERVQTVEATGGFSGGASLLADGELGVEGGITTLEGEQVQLIEYNGRVGTGFKAGFRTPDPLPDLDASSSAEVELELRVYHEGPEYDDSKPRALGSPIATGGMDPPSNELKRIEAQFKTTAQIDGHTLEGNIQFSLDAPEEFAAATGRSAAHIAVALKNGELDPEDIVEICRENGLDPDEFLTWREELSVKQFDGVKAAIPEVTGVGYLGQMGVGDRQVVLRRTRIGDASEDTGPNDDASIHRRYEAAVEDRPNTVADDDSPAELSENIETNRLRSHLQDIER